MYFSDQVFVDGPNGCTLKLTWARCCILKRQNVLCPMWTIYAYGVLQLWQVDKRPRVEHNDPSHPIAPRFDGVEVWTPRHHRPLWACVSLAFVVGVLYQGLKQWSFSVWLKNCIEERWCVFLHFLSPPMHFASMECLICWRLFRLCTWLHEVHFSVRLGLSLSVCHNAYKEEICFVACKNFTCLHNFVLIQFYITTTSELM
jgi:hypothetical protein